MKDIWIANTEINPERWNNGDYQFHTRRSEYNGFTEDVFVYLIETDDEGKLIYLELVQGPFYEKWHSIFIHENMKDYELNVFDIFSTKTTGNKAKEQYITYFKEECKKINNLPDKVKMMVLHEFTLHFDNCKENNPIKHGRIHVKRNLNKFYQTYIVVKDRVIIKEKKVTEKNLWRFHRRMYETLDLFDVIREDEMTKILAPSYESIKNKIFYCSIYEPINVNIHLVQGDNLYIHDNMQYQYDIREENDNLNFTIRSDNSEEDEWFGISPHEFIYKIDFNFKVLQTYQREKFI